MYYVYLHIRRSNGVPFYVGKGSGNRAWEFSDGRRNAAWSRVASARGVLVDIVQDSMPEKDAHLLEMWLIAKFRHEGIRLTNLTDGGEGCSGMIPWWRKAVLGIDSFGCIKRYDCAKNAAIEIGVNPKGSANIANCASGSKTSAYGFVWWYEGDPPKEHVCKYMGTKDALSRRVFSSLSEEFVSCSEAARYINGLIGVNTRPASISRACLNGGTLHGRAWSYIGFPDHPELTGKAASSAAAKKAKDLKKQKNS